MQTHASTHTHTQCWKGRWNEIRFELSSQQWKYPLCSSSLHVNMEQRQFQFAVQCETESTKFCCCAILELLKMKQFMQKKETIRLWVKLVDFWKMADNKWKTLPIVEWMRESMSSHVHTALMQESTCTVRMYDVHNNNNAIHRQRSAELTVNPDSIRIVMNTLVIKFRFWCTL